jgi:hypothetical protein
MSLPPVAARGWPCAGYSGPVNPSAAASICWSEPHVRQCGRTIERRLGRTAIMNALYRRTKRIGSSQREGETYTQQVGKIKNKPGSSQR